MGVVQDPVADMLTRIRNGQQAGHATVEMFVSNLKFAVIKILADRGYVDGVDRIDEGPQGKLVVSLRYDKDEVGMIRSLKRVSKPSRRVYVGVDEIPSVLNGLNLAMLSTSRGVLSDSDARAAKVGGELLCTVY